MGIGDNLLSSITGNSVQAVLTIYDDRALEEENQGEAAAPKLNSRLGGSVAGIRSKAASTAKFPDTIGTGLNAQGEKVSIKYKRAEKKIFVQFNPNTITIEAHGGGPAQVTNYGTKQKGNEKGSLEYTTLKTRISVKIPLIFDNVNNADAFLQDKLNLSATGLVKNVVSAGQSLFGDTVYTVQPQVEGLIAAIRNERTRRVSFSWANNTYKGLLNNVSAQYTMFNPEGRPIRAVVTISILCADESLGAGSMGQWDERYKEAFTKSDSTILKTASQTTGSFLNLG